MKTKVIKLLEDKNIPHKVLLHSNPAVTCEQVANDRGIPLEEVVKCILLVSKKKEYVLACALADKRIDIKKVKDIIKYSTRLSLADSQEIENILGYRKGSVPPLLLKTNIPIIFDDKIKEKQKVSISSGEPYSGLELNPSDLINLVKPTFAKIT